MKIKKLIRAIVTIATLVLIFTIGMAFESKDSCTNDGTTKSIEKEANIEENFIEVIDPQIECQVEAQKVEPIKIQADTEPTDLITIKTNPIKRKSEEVDLLYEQIEDQIKGMTIEEKVAGLFVVTPESITGIDHVVQAGEVTQNALEKYPVGGIIYFAKNIQSEKQLSEMIQNTIGFSKYPLFISVDEEGGTVARLANSTIGVSKVAPMADIGETGDINLAKEAGTTIGTYLSDYGFNVNFAPVADLLTNEESPMENRSFGSDPIMVSEMVRGFVESIQAKNVSSCIKHFPGIGDSEIDTHEGMASIKTTLEEMRTREFLPFIAGIEANTDFVMIGHVTVNDLDRENTASLSSAVINDILREELGYEGIVITDALNMKAITDKYAPEEIAIKALDSGVDMLLMPENFQVTYEAMLKAVKTGMISEERLDESLERIYKVKFKYKNEANS